MDNLWRNMLKKIIKVQSGLLRFKSKSEKISLHVEVNGHENSSTLHVEGKDAVYPEKLFNQAASIIQKTSSGYLFVSGYINSGKKNEKPILSLNVLKAQLFVRKANGQATWLEEASAYEQMKQNHELIL
mgnify:CR=1 FL=1